MTLDQIYEKLKMEHSRSWAKHGPWRELSHLDQKEAIEEEYEEWLLAYYGGDINGDHGEIAEALQLMNVLARRIMALTGERSA